MYFLQGDGEGGRGRGPPRRFLRRNFRGGRGGGGRGPRSQDGQGPADQGGEETTRGQPRLRYRRRGGMRNRGDNSQSEPANAKVISIYNYNYYYYVN